jgi:hypothetical protein
MVVDERLRGAVGEIVFEAERQAARKGHPALFGADAGNGQGQIDKLLRNLSRRPLVKLHVGERHARAGPHADSGRQRQFEGWVDGFHLSLIGLHPL